MARVVLTATLLILSIWLVQTLANIDVSGVPQSGTSMSDPSVSSQTDTTSSQVLESTQPSGSFVEISTAAKEMQSTDQGQSQEQGLSASIQSPKDPNEVDPRTPKPSPVFDKQFKPVNVDIEPIAGGVIRFDLKNLDADAACFCHLPDRIRKLENSQCLIPHRMTIHKDKAHVDGDPSTTELSVPMLRRLVGSINEVRLSTATQASFACVDGRQVHLDSPRTFGGDIVEVAQVLSFMAKQLKRSLTQPEVDEFMFNWLSSQRRTGQHEQFYHYTDLDALSKLTQWVRQNASVVGGQYLELTNVPDYLHRSVLEGLKVPENNGNLFLRLLLEFPDKFGADVLTIHRLQRTYFNLLWRKDKYMSYGMTHKRLVFVIAEGYHREKVFLDVRNSKYCVDEGIHSVLTIGRLEDQEVDDKTIPKDQLKREALKDYPEVAQDRAARLTHILNRQRQQVENTKRLNEHVPHSSFIETESMTTATTTTDPQTNPTASDATTTNAEPSSTSLSSSSSSSSSSSTTPTQQSQLVESTTALDPVIASSVDPVIGETMVPVTTARVAKDELTSRLLADRTELQPEAVQFAMTQGVDLSDINLAQPGTSISNPPLSTIQSTSQVQTGTETSTNTEGTSQTAAQSAEAAQVDAATSAVGGTSQSVWSENMVSEADEDTEHFLSSLVETLKGGSKHDVVSDATYPFDIEGDQSITTINNNNGGNGGALVLNSRYRPQDPAAMQAFIFNSQAVMNLRKQLVQRALTPFQIGAFPKVWDMYEVRAIKNDGLFKNIIAGSLPQYIVFMT